MRCKAFEGRAEPCTGMSLLLIWVIRGALPIAPADTYSFRQHSRPWRRGCWRGTGLRGILDRFRSVIRHDGLLLLAALVAAYLAIAWREDGTVNRKAFWLDFGEICLLWTFFLLSAADPCRRGVFLCLALLEAYLPADADRHGSAQNDRAGTHRARHPCGPHCQSAPLTVIALGMLAGLYLILQSHGSPEDWEASSTCTCR